MTRDEFDNKYPFWTDFIQETINNGKVTVDVLRFGEIENQSYVIYRWVGLFAFNYVAYVTTEFDINKPYHSVTYKDFFQNQYPIVGFDVNFKNITRQQAIDILSESILDYLINQE